MKQSMTWLIPPVLHPSAFILHPFFLPYVAEHGGFA